MFRCQAKAWRDNHNKSRPHRALNNLSPFQFVASIDY
ncbi:integrase core domain-containing protein [Plesiomonas shigelloides]